MSSGSSCSGTEACRQPCPRDERHPDRSADSQSAQSDPARPSTTGLPQARHPPSPRPGAKAQQQPHKAAPQHRQGEPKGRSDRPLRPAPIPGTPLRVAPDPKAQSRQAKSQTPLCPSHAALEARPNSLISQRSSQYEPSDLLRCELVIKLETANPIRSFKGRGTEVLASRIAQNFGPQAAVCASAGNLGQALAYSGRRRGIEITVIAGSSANATKIDRIRQLGATVELVEGDIEDARTRAREIADGGGAFLVEDSENLDTCEGAGTIGLELLDKFDGIDAVLLALGGGALATGVGHVFKSMAPMTEVVCIQPKGAPAMALSWHARSIITTESTDTIADGVAGRFPILAVLNDLLAVADHVSLVEEASIVEGMRMLYRHAGLIVEPSAALGIAAILENPSRFRDKRVVSVICGSNVHPEALIKWLHD